ncbi:ABC transporter substrate-binding protein [Streptomyces rugosispiralis]|uniref:Sugar ABC transporter substrate-binding protein n=1 Tax=Streptomyces rugosispiralis TaxID=2967341 RepID=A0ABT1UT04_9ACTN|nr:sugar ABC transporter substrate-binding protein [Streptomyces rugosispiralis]MCQ8188246.1 sugar ABC transporter substrate-binding protein [Streptomyces rugosispiralis]
MKRRLLVGVTAAAAAWGMLVGCSSSSSTSNQSKDKLVWSMWIAGSSDKAAWQQVANSVSAQGGPKVTIQGAPFNDYFTKLRTQLSTGSAPCVVSIQSLRAANYTDVLRPIDSYAKKGGFDLSAFDTTALNGMKVDGKLYALPYDTGPMLLFYNKDLFKQVGAEEPKPGWKLADFTAAAAKFKAAGKTMFASSVADMNLESMILGYNGGRVIKADGTLDPSNPTFAKGLDWLSSLVKNGTATQAGADNDTPSNNFVSKKVGMYLDGPWSLLSQKDKVKFPIGVTTIPTGHTSGPSTFSAGSGFGISKQCAYPDQAFTAIKTMTSQKVLTTLARQGRAFPGRTAAQQTWYENAHIDGVESVLKTAQKASTPLPGNKQSDQLQQLFSQYGIQAVNGQQSGAETMKSIAGQLGQ